MAVGGTPGHSLDGDHASGDRHSSAAGRVAVLPTLATRRRAPFPSPLAGHRLCPWLRTRDMAPPALQRQHETNSLRAAHRLQFRAVADAHRHSGFHITPRARRAHRSCLLVAATGGRPAVERSGALFCAHHRLRGHRRRGPADRTALVGPPNKTRPEPSPDDQIDLARIGGRRPGEAAWVACRIRHTGYRRAAWPRGAAGAGAR